MNISVDAAEAMALDVELSADTLTVRLTDGRTISAPLAWFPRLLHSTPSERSKWRLIGSGAGIHWTQLDEDISVASLLAGRKSDETAESLARWLKRRAR
jgi:hypothetical protein